MVRAIWGVGTTVCRKATTGSCCRPRAFGTAVLEGAREGNLVRFLQPAGGSPQWGILRGAAAGNGARLAQVVDDVLSGLGHGSEVEVGRVLPPLPIDPAPAVIFIGLNYKSHAAETGQELPQYPVFAYKNPAAVIGTEVSISIPPCAREKPEVDFEGELAIVLRRHLRDASPEDALDAVLGVTGSNDVSARRWQGKKGGGQWSRAKSFDTFCPLGPTLLPLMASAVRSALAPGGPGLKLRTILNGEVMQDGQTSDMLFGIGALLSYLSQGTTLLPGTVIQTGTPPGVGYVRKPPRYLKEGDRIEVELEGAGTLSNWVENGL